MQVLDILAGVIILAGSTAVYHNIANATKASSSLPVQQIVPIAQLPDDAPTAQLPDDAERPMTPVMKMTIMLLAWKKLGGNCEVMADDIINGIKNGDGGWQARAAIERFLQVEPMCTAFVNQNGGY